jgi:hypothetical protein
MVGLMGVFMIVAAFKVEWRKPILYSLLEKAFMVYLVVANGNHSYSQGFKAGAAMDATVVLYTIRAISNGFGRGQLSEMVRYFLGRALESSLVSASGCIPAGSPFCCSKYARISRDCCVVKVAPAYSAIGPLISPHTVNSFAPPNL